MARAVGKRSWALPHHWPRSQGIWALVMGKAAIATWRYFDRLEDEI